MTNNTPESSPPSRPAFTVPPGACDCHVHIYDDRFPELSGHAPLNYPVSAYRRLQQHIGTTRSVIVAPRCYLTDPQCTIDAIAQLGLSAARGIATVHPNVTDAELKKLSDAGFRGIRFTIGNPSVAVTAIDMIEPLAKRINDYGWHVQIHMKPDQIVQNAELLQRLGSPIVFDHMGSIPPSAGVNHPAFHIVRRLLDQGRAWVKLSGAFLYSELGPPDYGDLAEIARAYIRAAPERVVWGTAFPQPEKRDVPEGVVLMNLLAQWAPDERMRHRILVDNPAALYGFSQSNG